MTATRFTKGDHARVNDFGACVVKQCSGWTIEPGTDVEIVAVLDGEGMSGYQVTISNGMIFVLDDDTLDRLQ